MRVGVALVLLTACGGRNLREPESPARGFAIDAGPAFGGGRGPYGYGQVQWYGAGVGGEVRGWYDGAEDATMEDGVRVPRPTRWSLGVAAGIHSLIHTHFSRTKTETNCDFANPVGYSNGRAQVRCNTGPVSSAHTGWRGGGFFGGLQLDRGATVAANTHSQDPLRATAVAFVRAPLTTYGDNVVPRSFVDIGLSGVVVGRGTNEHYWGHAPFTPGGFARVQYFYYLIAATLETGITGLTQRDLLDGSQHVDKYIRLMLTVGWDFQP